MEQKITAALYLKNTLFYKMFNFLSFEEAINQVTISVQSFQCVFQYATWHRKSIFSPENNKPIYQYPTELITVL